MAKIIMASSPSTYWTNEPEAFAQQPQMYISAASEARPLPAPEQKAQPLLTAPLPELGPLVEVPPVQYLEGVLSGSVHLALVEVARRRPLVPALGPWH